MSTTNNSISDINNISVESKNKNKIPGKLFIILGILIGLIFISVLVIVIVLANKKEKKPFAVRNYFNDTEIVSNDTSERDETSNSIEVANISIDYASAEKLIDSEIIKENHNLLNASLNNINESILMFNNINLSLIETTVIDNPKNLDFLLTSNESSLKVAKDDIDLYKSRYVSLSQETNAFTRKFSDSLNNSISSRLNEFNNEINNITKQYEERIKNLAIPFYLNSNQTNQKRNLKIDELLDKYKKEIENLNNFEKSFFECIDKASKNLHTSISKVKDTVESLINKVNSGISKFKEDLKVIAQKTLHKELIEIKNSFTSFKNDMDESKASFGDLKKEIAQLLEEMEKLDSDEENNIEIINNINNLIVEIEKDSEVIASNLFSNIIIPVFVYRKEITTLAYLISYLLASYVESEVDKMMEIANVEISTSLDLLFIMDITGSMSPYIQDAKENILLIINSIINECPGIDINLGFIGYRDYNENYTDIDFTKNHTYLKSIINKVYASGGGDIPEDVAFALELALNKTWKSNARMAVFVADAPGHGKNYSDYGYYLANAPERRLIEEMITEMAEKNIALFCYKISYLTDKMFQVFENIYNDKKFNNTKFQIVSNKNSLSDVVINYSVEVYNEQRKNTDSLSSNSCDALLLFFDGIELLIPKNNYSENLEINIKNFENHRQIIKKNGGYIEDQHNYEDMNYGKKTIAYSGCEIIATYNAIYFLTKDENLSFPEMIDAFEKNGMLLNGEFGTSPHSIEIYLKLKGYNTNSSCNKEEYDNIGENYDVLIITFYNNKDNIFDMVHTTAVTKDNGKFHIHNNGYNSQKVDYNSISELFDKIDDGMTQDIYLIGIKK